jgi:hypothetical protein
MHDLLVLATLPMDRRHNAKIDYPKLRLMLAAGRFSPPVPCQAGRSHLAASHAQEAGVRDP